jgi:hypothetical protein
MPTKKATATTVPTAAPRLGRPPTGAGGELASQYPQLTVRIPPATRNALHSLSTLRRVPVWKLVDQAVLALVEQLPESERKLLKQFSARMAG